MDLAEALGGLRLNEGGEQQQVDLDDVVKVRTEAAEMRDTDLYSHIGQSGFSPTRPRARPGHFSARDQPHRFRPAV